MLLAWGALMAAVGTALVLNVRGVRNHYVDSLVRTYSLPSFQRWLRWTTRARRRAQDARWTSHTVVAGASLMAVVGFAMVAGCLIALATGKVG